MNFITKYRDKGETGAILDEYEKSINELKQVINNISNIDLIEIVDHNTKDEHCKSIQTILAHVVRAGYTYAIEIRKWMGETIDYKDIQLLNSSEEYIKALDLMFEYNEKLFKDYPNIKFEENDSSKKMLVRWGQKYDVEQLLEHAIVHILRHRRQIERFKIKLESNN